MKRFYFLLSNFFCWFALAVNSQPLISPDSLIQLGEYQARRDLVRSNASFQLAFKTLSPSDPKVVVALSNIAINYNRLGKRDSTDLFFKKADSARNKHLKSPEAHFAYFLSLSMMNKAVNKFPEAIDCINKILTHPSLSKFPRTHAEAYHQLGVIFQIIGQNESALSYYEKALKILDRYPDELTESFCLHQMGLLMHNQYDFVNSEKYYVKSIELQKTIDDRKSMAVGLSNLAGLYRETNRLEKALETVEVSIQYSSELGEVRLLNNCKLIKCLILSDLNREADALALMNECLETAKNIGQLNQYSYVLTEMAEIDFKKKKIKEAREKVERSLLAAERSKRADPRLNSYELYFKVLADQKEFEKAWMVNLKYQNLKDSITSIRGNEKLKIMEAEQQLKLQTDQIELLLANEKLKEEELKNQRAIQIGIVVILLVVTAASIFIINRQRALARIKRTLELEKVRNRIARDLHDDLGSSLSAIKVLSQTALLNDQQTRLNLYKIKDKASTLLDNMSDTVWTVDANNDSFSEVIARMREYANDTLEPTGIAFSFSVNTKDHFKFSLGQRKSVYLIFKEAINNAVKYSRAKNISVNLVTNGVLEITVQDDGIGFNQSEVKRGNGLNNFEARAREIGGVVKIKTEIGKGTAIHLSAPLT